MADDLSPSSTSFRYFLATLLAVVALTVRYVLSPVLGPELYLFFALWPAVAFSAWYFGLGPSIVTVLVGGLGVSYWLMPPVNSFGITRQEHIYGLLAFLFFAGLVVALGESNRRAQAAVRKAQAELEDRVKERTSELRHSNQVLSVLLGRFLKAQADERSLYQPSLKELGFELAARMYVEQFAAENGIKVEIVIARGIGRLPAEIDAALFRTLQTSLMDACLNMGNASAKIQLTRAGDRVMLTVGHNGKPSMNVKGQYEFFGMSGLVLNDLNEIFTKLGGQLTIAPAVAGTGTRVEAQIPIPANAQPTKARSQTASSSPTANPS